MELTEPDAGARAAAEPSKPAAVLLITFTEFVGLVALLMALTALSIDIMLPALPEIGRTLGVSSENDRQLVIILYMVGFSAGQLIYGPMSDRLGRRPVLLGGLAVFIAGTVAALFSDSFTALLAARLIQGLGAASPRVVAVAIVRDLYTGRQMARVMSLAMMVFIVIPVLAPSIGQGLIQLGNWRWTFYGLMSAGVAATVWAGLRLPETGETALGAAAPMPLARSFKAVLLNPQTAAYGLASGFMFGCLLAYVASSQQVFVNLFKLGDEFPLAFGSIASTLAFASYLNSRIVGHLGMRRVSHVALAAFVAVSLMLAAAALLGFATLPVFIVLVGAAFFLFGLIAPNFNSLAMEPQGHNAGMASSVIGSLSTAIGAVAGGLIGRSFDGTVLPLALGFAGSSVVALAIVVLVEGRAGLFGRNQPLL